MRWRETTFRPVRKRALKRWLAATKRSRERVSDDDFSSAFECDWQRRAEDIGSNHIALFCGIGEWASHITDVLFDASNDNLRFNLVEHHRRLSRHYFRLMLVVAELLNDFEDVLKKTGITDGRNRLSGAVAVDDVQAFVNQVVKHKAKAIHRHDHHLPMVFEDSGKLASEGRVVRVGARDFNGHENFDLILVPSLDQLLDVAIQAYEAFNHEIANETVFENICREYEQRNGGLLTA